MPETFPDLLAHPLAIQVLGLALMGWLSRHFAARKDVDGLGTRVTAAETRLTDLERAQELLQTEQRHTAEKIAEHIIQPLKEITIELRGLREDVTYMKAREDR